MIGFPKPEKRQKKRKAIPRMGRKGLEWEACKKLLTPAFAEAGITSCEVGRFLDEEFPEYRELIANHRHRFFLTYAHGDKRKQLVGNELLTLVVLSCVDCHDFIEALPRAEMRGIVTDIIKRRRVQPVTYFMEVPK